MHERLCVCLRLLWGYLGVGLELAVEWSENFYKVCGKVLGCEEVWEVKDGTGRGKRSGRVLCLFFPLLSGLLLNGMRRAVGGTGLPSYPSPRSESPSLSLSRQRLLGVGEGSRGSVWIPGTMRLKLPRSMIVLFLFIINLLNYMDRLTIAGIISELQLPPSLGGFGITDSEAGILSSIFVFTYMLLSPVFGFLGDRVPRKAIMAIGVLVWASSTFLCSFASSYSQLLVFRSMVGFGEASYATIAPTLIADLFPVDRRATALAFYFVATPVGSALGKTRKGANYRLFSSFPLFCPLF